MKSHKLTAIFSVLLLLFILSGCSEESPTSADGQVLDKYSTGGPGDGSNYNLSPDEKAGLIHMRLEEKVARDLYSTFNDLYKYKIFLNIKLSEQKHMDAVKQLLTKYGIDDPITSNEVGVFPDGPFQDLYNNMVAKGTSLTEAFKVGVEIEELDIEDLGNQLTTADSPDIIRVYTNLMFATERHLAAFNSCLIRIEAN